MSVPILATKLFIPPIRSNIVERTRLIELLNTGLESGRRLTLISAPAGFGKTTLISDWIAQCNQPAAWLTLEEGDSDLTRFLVYFITSLQTISASIGRGILDILQSPQPPSTEIIISTLINEINAIQGTFILVLDDYHTIDSKQIEKAMTFLIEHQPRQMHLVIASREDPDLPLARMRARAQMTELRASDLRFTPTEAAEFLTRMMGLDLSADDITALDKRTEGWIAGLQLAAISLQGTTDVAGFMKSFTGSHRFVMDYLLEEVLHRQPVEIQSFLLCTSILENLSGSLCESVVGPSLKSGQETLEYLDRSNLFIIPLDNQRCWYRYHHLFRDLLKLRLLTASASSAHKVELKVDELHMRASNWFELNGMPFEAIHHALAAEDFEHAATLIEVTVPAIRKNRQGTTITELGWLKALPEELVESRPVLAVAYAYALFGNGQPETSEEWLRKAEKCLEESNQPIGQSEFSTSGIVIVDIKEFNRLPGMIALLRTAQSLAKGDMALTVKNARRVLALAPEDDYLMLGGAASTLGLAAWASGAIDTARQMIAEGMTKVRQAGYVSPAIGDAITLADIQIVQGHLKDAMSTYRQGLLWATENETSILRGAADMHVGMSNLYYERNDLQSAIEHLNLSKNLGELAGLPQNPYRWCAAMASIRKAQGDITGAIDLLDRAECLYNGNFSPNVRPVATRKVRLWLAKGRLDDALKWVNEQKLTSDDHLSYLREFDHITLVRVLLARYQFDQDNRHINEASRLLDRLLKEAKDRQRNGSVIEILALQVMVLLAQGNQPEALLSLQQALTLAEPEGYVRVFLDEGSDMCQILGGAADRGILPEYTAKLLAAFELEGRTSEDKLDTPSAQTLIEPLSFRELEVLKLLRSNLSGPEIAQQLHVSINTFRTHTKNIFIKLEVNDRRTAIQRAEELKLV